ncbi:hypothetical protein WICPIJ_001619 [Wickerhamomyces pijperi]|uniref:Uncharacterized protein n=1 Tax=Wickerhamomyces pijperi TaxID=599730 RepID=A0A9P8TQF3_WICPI|nr:hypothetical protein WICPIJ_001619 [Wickerhamomyces pijperi]
MDTLDKDLQLALDRHIVLIEPLAEVLGVFFIPCVGFVGFESPVWWDLRSFDTGVEGVIDQKTNVGWGLDVDVPLDVVPDQWLPYQKLRGDPKETEWGMCVDLSHQLFVIGFGGGV